jgi:hypothetical protein
MGIIIMFNYKQYLLATVLPASDIASVEDLASKYNAEYGSWKGLTVTNVQEWLKGLALNCEFTYYDIFKLTQSNQDAATVTDYALSVYDAAYWQGLANACYDLIELHHTKVRLETSIARFDILDECEVEVTALFDESLDDNYSHICEQLPVVTTGSELLKTFDPTAYRCGLVDFADGLDLADFDSYNELQDALTIVEDELSDLDSIINEA